ncbi:hypothetical protein E2C01_064320 [Portunus trituberculatus]|uniref:Uncharacterized protein n=1 Tax=Portunus trituberculatus TaxID=210409 RepID=A0A5B7HIR2_PORTR|nr:hypothetical protein [Portunus trituberculatus]
MRQSCPHETSRVAILENEAAIILIDGGLWFAKVILEVPLRCSFILRSAGGDWRRWWRKN